MMVNNSTNINKANNDLSPQIIENKKTMTYDRNPGPGLGQAQIVAGVKPVNGMPLWYHVDHFPFSCF